MEGATDRVPHQVLVRFAPGVDASTRAAVRRSVSSTLKHRLPVPGLELLHVDRPVDAAVAALEHSPSIVYAEPNYVYSIDATPNDPRFGELWGLHNTGQTIQSRAGTPDADIDAPEAWNTMTGASDVTVAVVDSGVAYDHPDLSHNIWSNPHETPNGVDDDGNGYIDDVRGWDWVQSDNAPYDYDGHGTHVAGTIAAVGSNGVGTTGVAWDSSIMPLRVLDSLGSGTNANIVSAFAYAADNGADVVNASLGGSDNSQSMADVIAGSPGTLFVVAAGNSNSDNDVTATYPCNFPAANLVCVAATDNRDARADFSNYGASSVDLGAPGVSILSTVPPSVSQLFDTFNDSNLDGWSTGGTGQWGIDRDNFGPFASDSPGIDYAPNTDTWLQSGAMNFTGLIGCKVEFWVKSDTQSAKDMFTVEASTNGSAWTPMNAWSGQSGGWVHLGSSLERYDGASEVHLRFRLKSDSSVEYDGVGIDDVAVGCTGGGYSGDEYSYLEGTSMASPQVAGAAAVLFGAVPSAAVSAVRQALIDGVDPTTSMTGKTTSGGRLNLKTSLDLISAAQVSFSRTTLTVPESAGVVQLKLNRSGNPGTTATVHIARTGGSATPGSDFALGAGTATFGQSQTSTTVPLTVTNDRAKEAGETIVLTLSSPGLGTELAAPTSMRVTIATSDQRPDGLISTAARTGYVGNNVYNATGAHQAKTVSARRSHTRTFYARVGNDGNVTDAFKIRGSAARAGSRVRFFRGTTEITSAMRSAAGWAATLAPGASKTIRMRIRVRSTAAFGSTKPGTVTATWTGDGSRSDTVRGVVRVRRR